MNNRAVTIAYSTLTVSDGAFRMLVLFHCAALGYDSWQLAGVFALYELAGIVTNLWGGRLVSSYGTQTMLRAGIVLQITVLLLCAIPATFPSFAILVLLQGLAGVAKDLTKVSAKSAVATTTAQPALFRWVAGMTGSKNSMKGLGFFIGALFYTLFSARGALIGLIGILLYGVWWTIGAAAEPRTSPRSKPPRNLFSRSTAVNRLAVARCFLFGAREVWLALALPLWLALHPGWGFWQSGAVLALYTIGYGIIQAVTPRLISPQRAASGPGVALTTAIPALVCVALALVPTPLLSPVLMVAGVGLFSVCFAVASAVHSFVIAAYAKNADVSHDIGVYYAANALGRFGGLLCSGYCYSQWGMVGALIGAALWFVPAALIALGLPQLPKEQVAA